MSTSPSSAAIQKPVVGHPPLGPGTFARLTAPTSSGGGGGILSSTAAKTHRFALLIVLGAALVFMLLYTNGAPQSATTSSMRGASSLAANGNKGKGGNGGNENVVAHPPSGRHRGKRKASVKTSRNVADSKGGGSAANQQKRLANNKAIGNAPYDQFDGEGEGEAPPAAAEGAVAEGGGDEKYAAAEKQSSLGSPNAAGGGSAEQRSTTSTTTAASAEGGAAKTAYGKPSSSSPPLLGMVGDDADVEERNEGAEAADDDAKDNMIPPHRRSSADSGNGYAVPTTMPSPPLTPRTPPKEEVVAVGDDASKHDADGKGPTATTATVRSSSSTVGGAVEAAMKAIVAAVGAGDGGGAEAVLGKEAAREGEGLERKADAEEGIVAGGNGAAPASGSNRDSSTDGKPPRSDVRVVGKGGGSEVSPPATPARNGGAGKGLIIADDDESSNNGDAASGDDATIGKKTSTTSTFPLRRSPPIAYVRKPVLNPQITVARGVLKQQHAGGKTSAHRRHNNMYTATSSDPRRRLPTCPSIPCQERYFSASNVAMAAAVAGSKASSAGRSSAAAETVVDDTLATAPPPTVDYVEGYGTRMWEAALAATAGRKSAGDTDSATNGGYGLIAGALAGLLGGTAGLGGTKASSSSSSSSTSASASIRGYDVDLCRIITEPAQLPDFLQFTLAEGFAQMPSPSQPPKSAGSPPIYAPADDVPVTAAIAATSTANTNGNSKNGTNEDTDPYRFRKKGNTTSPAADADLSFSEKDLRDDTHQDRWRAVNTSFQSLSVGVLRRIALKSTKILTTNRGCSEVLRFDDRSIHSELWNDIVHNEFNDELVVLEWGSTCGVGADFLARYFTNASANVSVHVMSLQPSAEALRYVRREVIGPARALMGHADKENGGRHRVSVGQSGAHDSTFAYSTSGDSSSHHRIKACPDYGGDMSWLPTETFHFVSAWGSIQQLYTALVAELKGRGGAASRPTPTSAADASPSSRNQQQQQYGVGSHANKNGKVRDNVEADRSDGKNTTTTATPPPPPKRTRRSDAPPPPRPPHEAVQPLCRAISDLLRATKVGGSVWLGHFTDHTLIDAITKECVVEGYDEDAGHDDDANAGALGGGGVRVGEDAANNTTNKTATTNTNSSSSPSANNAPNKQQQQRYTIEYDVIAESMWLGGYGFGISMSIRTGKPRGVLLRKVPYDAPPAVTLAVY